MPASLSRGSSKFVNGVRIAIALVALLLLPGIGRLRQATNAHVDGQHDASSVAVAAPIPHGVLFASGRSNPADHRGTHASHTWHAARTCEPVGATAALENRRADRRKTANTVVSVCGYRATAPPSHA